MATTSNNVPMVSLVLDCPICMDSFQNPRILPCGHTFCHNCLKNITRKGQLTCPKCRHSCTLPVENLPVNYIINELQGTNTSSQSEQPNTQSKNEVQPTYVSVIDGNNEAPAIPQTSGTVVKVLCQVCYTSVNVTGKLRQQVVKCPKCNENTAIRPAPSGKKYVRCSCNCLLVCNSSSTKIVCARPSCKRIITFGSSPVKTTVIRVTPATNSNFRRRYFWGVAFVVFLAALIPITILFVVN